MAEPAAVAIHKARAGARLTAEDGYALAHLGPDRTEELLAAARELADRHHPGRLTYSPKVFLPVTNLCRDRCTYCTFRRDPGDPGEWTMSPEEIAEVSRRGRERGCIEALMCLGDKPEVAFRGFKKFLSSHGCDSTAEYVGLACEVSLGEGLLPHTNAGLLSREEMAMLRPLAIWRCV